MISDTINLSLNVFINKRLVLHFRPTAHSKTVGIEKYLPLCKLRLPFITVRWCFGLGPEQFTVLVFIFFLQTCLEMCNSMSSLHQHFLLGERPGLLPY